MSAVEFDNIGGGWSPPSAVDASPKRLGFIRKAIPYAVTAVKMLAALWPISVALFAAPVIVIIGGLIGVAVLPPAAALFGPAIASVATFGGVLLHRGYRARVVRSMRRCQELAFRLYWPMLCGLCGLVMPGARRARVPDLVTIEFGDGWRYPEWIRLRVIPLAQHDRPTWHRYADRLAREIGYRFSSWVPCEETGGIEITCRLAALPTMVEVGTHIPLASIGANETAETGVARDQVTLGLAARGGEVVWRPDESGRSHLLVAGRTGGGKGVIGASVLAHAVAVGWRVYCCNPAKKGEFRWLRHTASIAKTPAGMFAMVNHVRLELERRADVLDEVFGVADWSEVPLDELASYGMDHRVLLFIDELVKLTNMRGTVPPPPPPADWPKKQRWQPLDPFAVAMNDLQVISSTGRALGVSIAANFQHGISEHLGPFGSTMRSNFGARIIVGSTEPEGAAAVFGKSSGETIAEVLRAGTPGRMVYQGVAAADGGQWQLGQAQLIPRPLLPDFVPDVAAYRSQQFDEPIDDVIDLNNNDDDPNHDSEQEREAA